MALLLFHPEVATRDCAHCQKYVYDEKTGLVELDLGEPLARGKGHLPPCRDPAFGCHKGTPEEPLSLTEQNEHVYRHYRECRAVGRFPDDELVLYHAGIVRQMEELAERRREERLQASFDAMFEWLAALASR